MKKVYATLFFAMVVLLGSGCSTTVIMQSEKKMPKVYKDINESSEMKKSVVISLFQLDNFTDTPRAGKRAANIVEGILESRGYIVKSHIDTKVPSLKKAAKIAKDDDAKYFMMGGISEWRYKTGIDGEPAVSLKVTLYKTKNKKVRFSATGASSDWGNASLGTVTQELVDAMIDVD